MKRSTEFIRLLAIAQLRATRDRRKFKIAVRALQLALKLQNEYHIHRCFYLVRLHGGVV